uniref:Uncharacterized protein n=1 Tax=Caenorhabditis japonica TaxID=281687 RepID=A0A8R1DPP3_CAEJA
MLDEPTFAVFYACLVVISNVFSVVFIFTVITKSTADMKLYKYVLLKLAICDFLFNLSVSVLVTPDLLCPLSAVAIRSPIGGINETYGFVMVAVTIAVSISVFSSINDCSFIRVCIFYQWHSFLQKFYSWRGVFSCGLLNAGVISVIIFALWLASNTNNEFLAHVTAENMTHALGTYALRPETVYFYVNIWRPQVLPLLGAVIVGLAGVHVFNLFASRLVWKEIATRRKNMSLKSYQNHRQLTLLVLFQNLLPAAALSVPLLIVTFSFLMRYKSDTFAELIKHFVTFTIAIYPALSVFLSFLLIKPYKNFLVSLFCSFALRRIGSENRKVSDLRMVSRSRKESVGNESFDNVGYI